MALRAGYYGLKKKFIDKINKWDQIIFPRSEQAVLGAKNWLNIPKGTYTQFDVTIVVDDTGITLNGTCNATSGTQVNVNNLPISINAKVADYKGVDVANNMSDDCYIWMSSPFSGGNINGKSWTVSTAAKVTGALSIKGGVTYTNFKIQPMIVLASDSDLSTYAPYAMTNKGLTNKTAELYRYGSLNTNNFRIRLVTAEIAFVNGTGTYDLSSLANDFYSFALAAFQTYGSVWITSANVLNKVLTVKARTDSGPFTSDGDAAIFAVVCERL